MMCIISMTLYDMKNFLINQTRIKLSITKIKLKGLKTMNQFHWQLR